MRVVPVILLLLLAGCLGLGAAMTADSLADRNARFIQPIPDDSHAVVYFFGYKEFAATTFVYLNDQPVAILDQGHFTYVTLPPGRHSFVTKYDSEHQLILDVEGGGEYFVEFSRSSSTFRYYVKLVLISKESAQAAMRTLKYVAMMY